MGCRCHNCRNYCPIGGKPKSLDDLAHAVIRGEYGNGAIRKKLLGDLYSPVQQRVNEILMKKAKHRRW